MGCLYKSPLLNEGVAKKRLDFRVFHGLRSDFVLHGKAVYFRMALGNIASVVTSVPGLFLVPATKVGAMVRVTRRKPNRKDPRKLRSDTCCNGEARAPPETEFSGSSVTSDAYIKNVRASHTLPIINKQPESFKVTTSKQAHE